MKIIKIRLRFSKMKWDLKAAVSVRGLLRFRRVERIGAVADVLGAVKHPECQSGQEVPRGHVSSYRPDHKSRFTFESDSIVTHDTCYSRWTG